MESANEFISENVSSDTNYLNELAAKYKKEPDCKAALLALSIYCVLLTFWVYDVHINQVEHKLPMRIVEQQIINNAVN